MSHRHSLRDLLHWTTHRIPGVPAHTERPTGHQGQARHGHEQRHSLTHHHGFNHSPARPPRVLAAWQTRIARLFGQEPA
ncbi:hypothetical protein [Nonomuraea guangzhouensis]|uniref:Uncharacterized protein n=1 Tax=Nonomuraea guangzhouensis TaxID=1291555 RepID=A0ABW4GED9_9ACTN|nr:hypothetical protein [Nonomuraea guangzhouensis]